MSFLGTATASSLITAEIKAAIDNGLGSMSATVSDVILIVIPTTIAIIALTSGVRYALRKVKGVMSAAS